MRVDFLTFRKGVVMGAMSSSSNLARRLGFAGLFPSALLLMSIACSPAGRVGVSTVQPGLKNPPGRDEETRKFFKERVHFSAFGPNVTGYFKSGGNRIRVKVKPEKTTHSRSWHQSVLSKYGEGIIVGRIENVDHRDVPQLGLTTNDQFAHIWVGPLPSGKRGISFYVFDDEGYSLRKGTLDLDSFKFCPDYTGNKPDASFSKDHGTGPCEDISEARLSPTRSTASAQLTSYTPKPTRPVWVGGLWISCSGGCCDVGGGMFE
jgi:hypothetical protein